MIIKKKLLLIAMVFISVLALCGSAAAVDSQNMIPSSPNLQSLNDSSYNSTNTTVNQPSVNQTGAAPANQPLAPTNPQPASYEGVATPVNIQGYWINNGPDEIKNINITALKNAGITDIFVITNKQNPAGTLQPFINAFAGSGIRVHAWITCFKDQNGTWFDPGQNPALIDQLVNNLISIATNYNVDGIHLDYVRYPGTAYQYPNATETVTSFAQRVYNAIQNINSQQIPGKHQILLSAALMPETDKNAYYYGQDYGQLAPYLDFLVPMIYKGNYNQNTSWIGTTTQYIVQHAGGKPVVAGIQTYRSDSNPLPIPASELNADIKAALDNGSSGYVLFKYGLVDSSIPGIPNYQNAALSQITAAAATVKNYIETNQQLPSTVTIGTVQVKMSAFLHLLLTSSTNINHGNTGPVSLIDFREPLNPSESLNSGNIVKSEYLSIALSTQNFMDVNGMAPNYATSTLGKIRYETLIYMYSRILNYYGVNHVLPNYVSVKPWFSPLLVISADPAGSATGVSTTSPISITFNKNILAGPNFAGIYIKNLSSGNLVSIASKTMSGNTLTIKQTNPRLYNTTYHVYLPAGAVKDSAGNNLVQAYSYNFTTQTADTTAPKVTSTNPASNATGFSLTAPITITFSENILAGANFPGIYIKNLTTGKIVSIASKTISGNTLTIKMTSSRLSKNTYQVYIPAGAVGDAAGNSLAAPYTFQFKTA